MITENDGIRVYAKLDSAYLYLLVKGDTFDFEKDTLYLPLGILSGQGNTQYNGTTFDDGADFLLRLHGKKDSAVLVDA